MILGSVLDIVFYFVGSDPLAHLVEQLPFKQ